MLKPLEQWICDRCGEVIKKPKEGWVEWTTDSDTHQASGFKIVHHSAYSPRGRGGCYHYTDHPGRSDDHLDHVIEQTPMVYLLSFLDIGEHHDPDYRGPRVANMREFVEFARRLTIPYYEEARTYWSQAESDEMFVDANEIFIYLPSTLKAIVQNYGKQSKPKLKAPAKRRKRR